MVLGSEDEEKLDLYFFVRDLEGNETGQDCLCTVKSTDEASKVKDFVASALGYNPRYMAWFDDECDVIDFKKSWKDIPVFDRVVVYGFKGGDMQCRIQEFLCYHDDRNDEEVSLDDADEIINYLDKEDRTALQRAWAGDACDEWRDLVTEKMTLVGLKKWNEEAKPTEMPSKKLNRKFCNIDVKQFLANTPEVREDKLAERKEEKDQEDKKKDIKDKQDKKNERDKKKDKKHKKDKKDKEDKKDKKDKKKDKKNKTDKEEDKKDKKD